MGDPLDVEEEEEDEDVFMLWSGEYWQGLVPDCKAALGEPDPAKASCNMKVKKTRQKKKKGSDKDGDLTSESKPY